MSVRATLYKYIAAAVGSICLGDAALAASPDSSDELDAVVVTGSRIRRTAEETPSPVQVISREQIERSGEQSISDVIRNVSADNQGSLPTAFTAGFAAGASGVSLRGLGLNSTLVLVNGRRMATYGLADDGARTFVDLNTIPLEAVDRVEVVKDGASAIYGSDAVAGVINIILRENYDGAAFGAAIGTQEEHGGSHYALNGTWGTGDIAADRFNVFMTVEASRDEAIAQSDLGGFLGTFDNRSQGFFDSRRGAYGAGFGLFADGTPAYSATSPFGSYRVLGGTPQQRINILGCPEVNAVNGVCLFDPIEYIEIQPKSDRLNIYARGAYQFSEAAQGYLELGRFSSKVTSLGTPGSVNDTGVFNPADPLNPLTPPHTTVLPAGHPDNASGVNRTLSLMTEMLGGRNQVTDTTVIRVVGGVKGQIGAWSYDAGVAHIESSTDDANFGFVRHPVLQTALNAGTFRIDPSLNSPELLAAISPVLKRNAKSQVSVIDATVSRDWFELPGGKLGIALGAEYRKEKTDSPPVPFTDTGEIVGLGYSAFNSNRNVAAGYIEINAPVATFLDLVGAYRYDHYSDYGSSSTPKVGFKWTPIPQVSLRGTYSQAFRAPGPTESGNSSSLGFTNIAIITIGAPNVKPETADSFTVGLLIEPGAGISASIDYFDIRRENEIVTADQAVIIGGLPTTGVPLSRVPGAVPNSFLYFDDLGDLASISGPYANLNETNTSGFDVDLRHLVKFGGGSTLESNLLLTHTLSMERVLPDGSRFEYAGTHGPYVLSSAGGTPSDRASLEMTWSSSKYSLTGRINYVSAIDMVDHEGEELVATAVDALGGQWYATSTHEGEYFVADPNGVVCGVYNPDGTPFGGDCELPAFVTLDVTAKWSVNDKLDVSLVIDNLTDRRAPFDPYTYGGHNYNPAFHQAGAVGRFFTAGMKYRF
jgi:iron complex outermembrane recepter protein